MHSQDENYVSSSPLGGVKTKKKKTHAASVRFIFLQFQIKHNDVSQRRLCLKQSRWQVQRLRRTYFINSDSFIYIAVR